MQPNAGMPRRLGRQLRYAHNTDYFAECARMFAADGATVVGGCCGTTPAHVRAVARAVAGVPPGRPLGVVAPRPAVSTLPLQPDQEGPVTWPHVALVVLAGMPVPRGQDVPQFVAQAQQLRAAGANLITITGRGTPTTRINPIAAAVVLRERLASR